MNVANETLISRGPLSEGRYPWSEQALVPLPRLQPPSVSFPYPTSFQA